MRMRRFVTSVAVGTSLLLSACQGGANQKAAQPAQTEAKEKLTVYTSVYPVYDFTKMIAGDAADVKMLIPEGTEPHHWEPGTQEMNALATADVFVYNGAGLEEWVDKTVETAQKENADLLVVEASKDVELIEGHHHHHDEDEDHDHDHDAVDEHHEDADHDHDHDAVEEHHDDADDHDHDHDATEEHHDDGDEHEHHHGAHDPHTWLSPKNAKIMLATIEEGLAKADPDNKDLYEKNLAEAQKKMDDLAQEFADAVKDRVRDRIIVSHEAFGYLCRDYGLNQVGIEGVHSEHEPDPKTMAEIVDLVKREGVTTIFSETLIDPKVAETIAKESGAQVKVLNPVEGLTKDDVAKGADYMSIMKENAQALKEALH